MGNGKVDRLLAARHADAVLMQPVSSARVADMLQAVASGTLHLLLETRRSEPAADLPDVSGLSVLVADDSAVNREVVTEALTRLMAHSSTVEDGRRALEAFQSGQYDIILMDCSMPVMDGFEATRAIRAWEEENGVARTPVVALTAHVAGGAGDSWREAGMDDYLTKPFTIRGLADCLARWKGTAPSRTQELVEAALVGDGSPCEGTVRDEPLDPAVLGSLRAIAGGSTAMLDRILGLFLAHAPARVAALREAISAEDLPRIATEAHALKSPSLNIGAVGLAGLCSAIEAKARVADRAVLEGSALAQIEAEFAAVTEAIARERGSADPVPPIAVAALAV
jgi:two-component system sensor histidine kinase BarA